MIIEKKDVIQPNDVVGFRLTTGEEIIAKVVSISEASLTITKPIHVQMQMISAQQAGLAFGPFMSTVDENAKFVFSMDNLMCYPMKAKTEITKQYIKMTTGLEVASGLIGT